MIPANTNGNVKSPRFRRGLALGTAGVMLLAGCSAGSESDSTSDSAPNSTSGSTADAINATADASGAATTEAGADATPANTGAEALGLFDSNVVHTIEVDFDQADYDAMIEAYTATGDKEWISATVTLDGTTYDNVGLRLKGNSSLFGLTAATSGNPEDLPWLIRLNKFVDGEDHQGYEDIVIRSNSTETAMNEAVAQELLAMTGLAAQRPIATAFTVNGGDTELRLAVENPDEEWYEDNFDDEDGLLYKADSEGDYSYRGDDAEAYTDVFDQDVGDDDMEPLIDFLDFINNTDDATFSAGLADQLDLDAFATYLAFHELIGNIDDINGPGNNSYLQYDTTTERFTVVSWDLNLAFDTANVTGGAPGGAGGGRPAGGRPDPFAGTEVGDPVAGARPVGDRPDGAGGDADGQPRGPGDMGNVLVDRFLADAEFAALYDAKTAEVTELLFTSGTVDEVIANWADVLYTGAADLVSEATVDAEAAALISYVNGVR